MSAPTIQSPFPVIVVKGMLISSIVADRQVLFQVDRRMAYFQIPDARKLPTSVITFVNALDCNTEDQ